MRVPVFESNVACIIGNLFEGLEPPCDTESKDGLTIKGRTFSGNMCTLTISKQGDCIFEGEESDILAVINGKCPEERCKRLG